MDSALAYSTFAMTIVLAVSRPRIGLGDLRMTPGLAAVLGVFILLVTGLLPFGELWTSAQVQWRPLLALTSVMVMTGLVREVGAFDRVALKLEAHARGTAATRAFDLIFVAAVVTPTLLNNDAAILLLTPIAVVLARKLYPGNDKVLEAFVFAVFLAPGVAPLVVSNPMNLIVAEFVGLGFNDYARVMVPISVAGALLTFAILRFHYRHALTARAAPSEPVPMPARHPAELPALGLLLAVFLCYPIMAALGGPIWSVAAVGALGALIIARRHAVASPRQLASHVSLDILAFLWGIYLVVAGLRGVGVVERLTSLYHAYEGGHGLHLAVVGVVSALGSAIADNHPMSVLNMMALGNHEGTRPLLAALIGGDIGPRLLPIGSLAGLLWLDVLRRKGIEIGIGRFARLGTLLVLPTLALSLWMLWVSDYVWH
jgi:arsenical pump membrane protein